MSTPKNNFVIIRGGHFQIWGCTLSQMLVQCRCDSCSCVRSVHIYVRRCRCGSILRWTLPRALRCEVRGRGCGRHDVGMFGAVVGGGGRSWTGCAWVSLTSTGKRKRSFCPIVHNCALEKKFCTMKSKDRILINQGFSLVEHPHCAIVHIVHDKILIYTKIIFP